MNDTFTVNNDKARIAELEKGIEELSNQVDVMRRYITAIGKAIAERENQQVNPFLDPYDEDYISDILEMIHYM